MRTYLQVLRLFWTTAVTAELEYRFNFIIAMVSSFANLIGSLFNLFLFYGTGYTFHGWTWDEAMIVVGIFTFFQGISATFLVPNLNRIVEQVEKGTLDFVLLKPISSQFWLSCRILSPWGFSDLVFGVIIIFYFSSKLSLHLGDYILSCITIILGITILYGIWFILGATSVWFVKIYNVTEVLRGLLEAGRYPMSAYPTVYRFVFTFVIPITFLTTVPAKVLLGKIEVLWILGAILIALSLLLISHYFWQFALRFYTSASS
jgi:ABC-2 type transport system permease protein